MAIEIEEKLQVAAPIDEVWQFVTDPQRVVTCMPGAGLDEMVDDRTFLGTVKVKVGAITASYKGRVEFTEVDAQGHRIQMRAEGRETGGGTAKGTIAIRLVELAEGPTELVTEASIDLTGRIMQVGRGMIQGVSRQLFKQFASSTKALLEAPAAATGEVGAPAADVTVARQTPIRIVPLLLKALWEAIVRFFRRLFGGRAG
jgi:carbon monoxide dehydrogenase subunit G